MIALAIIITLIIDIATYIGAEKERK